MAYSHQPQKSIAAVVMLCGEPADVDQERFQNLRSPVPPSSNLSTALRAQSLGPNQIFPAVTKASAAKEDVPPTSGSRLPRPRAAKASRPPPGQSLQASQPSISPIGNSQVSLMYGRHCNEHFRSRLPLFERVSRLVNGPSFPLSDRRTLSR